MKRLALVIPLGVVLSASAAWACGNSMREFGPPRPNQLLAKANQAFKEGRFAEAAKLSDQVIGDSSRRADRAPALRVKGLAHLKLGNFSDAVSALEWLVRERKEPFNRVKLAEAQLRKAHAAEKVDTAALGALEKLTADGFVSDADALAALARARLASGNPTGAKAACDEALAVEPGHAEASQLLASLAAPAPKPPPTEPVKLNTKS